jgi:hypothetical protein
VELCDLAHLGLDDNCDGQVDEGCPCEIGQAHACFKGDPALHGAPGCFDGTELCTEQGTWGPCLGGVHAVPPDDCAQAPAVGLHAITTRPFQGVHLATGVGSFGADAVPGTETWTVSCPVGVMPCPVVGGQIGPDYFIPLQSGEYTVTYTKGLPDGGTGTGTYPLIVAAIGLRIELTWEHTPADNGVDLDLHVHQPNNMQPWGISPAVPQDCTWSNCVASDFQPPQGFDSPAWFAPPPAMPPMPVNWSPPPDPDNLTCYFDPGGVGSSWQNSAMGCHNPRLDADNITCDATVTDPANYSFCLPENTNIDYPPQDQWFRIGVHYYSNHGLTYDVHPTVRIFCNGALSGLLGPDGYYVPEAPVTFEAADGAAIGGNRFWVVADVVFPSNAAGACVVQPIHADAATKTPFFILDTAATASFDPAYPPLP